MRNIVNEYIKMFEENRRARRKTLGVIGILALFVAFGVFWNLHFTGIALTDEVYYCDKEEHEHDEKCYAWMLSDTSADCESTEEAAADVDEIIAADDTLSGEETVQADEVDPEVEAVQAAETETTEDAEQIVESASAEESTQASEMNEEEETEQTKEEASTEEAAVVEETGVSASETDELPAMVLAAEASESEEWYLNRGYVKTLICDKEEHTHTAQCLIDETADVETAEDWEATLPEELGDSATENLVAVAFSQLGYTESSANYIFADDGVTHKGYTRYGAWYGNTYGDWDAMFVAFCLHYAGISEEDFPVNSGAYAWAVQLAEADLYAAADEYTPNVGDLIFLDTDEDGKADLVGIVECVTEEAAEDNDQESVGDSTETIAFSITVILGDYTDEEEAKGDTVDKVCSITYSSTDERILGYGGLEYAVMAAKGLYKQTLTVIVDDLTLTVSGYLSEDANVSAEKVDLELEDQEIQFAIEISIYDADGNEFEPEDDTIAVTVESESITEDCVVYYVPEEGDLEKVTSEAKEGAASFDAEHFSLYAGISEETDSLYDTYMATIAEYEEQAHALETGDDASAVAITSDLGDLLSAVDEDYEAENLTEEEYTEIVDAINVLWDWLEENFDLYGMSTTADAAQGTYNTWTDLGSITNPASVGTIYDIQISGYNSSDDWGVLDNVSSNVSLSGNLFTELYHEKNSDSFMILLDVYKYYSTSAGRGGTDYSTYLDKNPTMKNCGTITISNVGTANGKSVDISFNIDSVAINSFASYYRQHLEYLTSRGEGYPESYQPGIHYGYLVIATISLGTLANGDTGWTLHMCDSYTGGGEFDRYRIWSTLSNGYAYPRTQTTTLSTKVTYSEDGTAVDSPFLVVSSDLDVTHGGASIANSLYGADYKESFSSLSGFSEYFYYYEDRNNLTITEQGTGKVTVSSNLNTSNLSGETSYLIGGIYGETISGSWTASYKVENCGSIVEVYLPPTDPYTVTIEKKSGDGSQSLSDAMFYLYKYKTNSDGTVGTTKLYYHYDNGTVTWLNLDEDNSESPTSLVTGADGTVTASGPTAGTYYLTEVIPPDGYALMEEDVGFVLSTFGTIILTADSSDSGATIANLSTLEISLPDEKSYDVILEKADADGNAIEEQASFYLYKTVSGVTYYYRYAPSAADETVYVTTWVTDSSDATVIVTGSDGTGTGQVTLHDLTEGTYYLEETEAPEGYTRLTDALAFTVGSSGSLSVSGSQENIKIATASSGSVVQVINQEAPSYQVTLQKLDEDSNALTSGHATFYLYKVDNEGNKTYYYYDADGNDGNGETSWVDTNVDGNEATLISTDLTYGQATMYNLVGNTTYYLEEVSAPGGYATLSQVIEFTLSSNGKITVLAGNSYVTVNDSDTNNLMISVQNIPAETTDVTVVKYDDEEGVLADAVFKLYKYDTSGNSLYYKYTEDSAGNADPVTSWESSEGDATELISGSTGSITLHGLTGNATYYLEETEAPYEYALLSDPIVFTITATGSTGNISYSLKLVSGDNNGLVSVDESNVLQLNVENEKAVVYDFIITKKETGTEKIMQGAGFYLYRVVKNSAGDDVKYYYKYETGSVSWVEDIEDASKSTSNNKGTLSFLDLPPGTYYLYEAVVPDGYNSLEADISITIDNEGNLSLNDKIDYAEIDGAANQVRLIVYNTPGYELPSAGGMGTILYTTTGLTFIISAAWLMYRQKRRGRERIRGG